MSVAEDESHVSAENIKTCCLMATATARMVTKKPRSHVWQYFTKSPGVDGQPLCICNLCNTVIQLCGCSTSNLARHLRLRHKIIPGHSTRSESSTMAPDSPTFKLQAHEKPDNSPDTLILECTDFDETLEKNVSVTQFFERTKASMAGSSACVLCGCVFGPTKQSPDNLLAHLIMKHEDDVPSDLWPLLKASAEKDSGQESSKAATQDDEELDHFPAENNSISEVERLWSRHCAEQEKDYQAELFALDLQAAEFQGRLSELQRMLAGVKERRSEAEARRRKELLRQHQLKKQFILATAAPKNQDPICDTRGGEAMQKRKTGNDSMMAGVIKHRKRPASLTSGRLPGHTQRRPTNATLITGRPSGHTQRANAKGTRNGCGTGRDMVAATDSSNETDNVKL